jgi:hypothetical protein
MAHNLRPFRDYDEHDVINLFTYSGASTSLPLNKGMVVKVVNPGFSTLGDAGNPIENLGSLSSTAFPNSVSSRFGVKARVTAAASGDRQTIGLTLMDMRETDENGEKLIFNPRKAAEMGVIVSGQAVPILTKGVVTYSGTAATAGDYAFVGATDGELVSSASLPATAVKVGRWLTTAGSDNIALLKIEL